MFYFASTPHTGRNLSGLLDARYTPIRRLDGRYLHSTKRYLFKQNVDALLNVRNLGFESRLKLNNDLRNDGDVENKSIWEGNPLTSCIRKVCLRILRVFMKIGRAHV